MEVNTRIAEPVIGHDATEREGVVLQRGWKKWVRERSNCNFSSSDHFASERMKKCCQKN